jgi:uncharacterized membrane protein YjgN (DUF898 family)
MADTAMRSGVIGGGAGPNGERLVAFFGNRASLFGILIVNFLLGLVTLGIYRFWARTRLRQFFWNAIAVDGEPLEYTGRGLELFIGFLIVVAVLTPLLIAYQFLAVFLQTTAPDVFDAVNFLYFVTLLWLGQYAYFRARRYRLARTVWRGIRAGQDGSASGYAWLWFGYAVLSVITLGWAVPWMTVELQKYEVEKARFGVENFRYDGTGSQLFWRWVPCATLWTLGILIAIVATVVNWVDLQQISELATEFGDSELAGTFGLIAGERVASIYGLTLLAFLLSIPFLISYRIAAFRYMFRASNLSDINFTAEFSGWRLVGYWVLYFVVIVVVLIFVAFFLFGAVGGLAALSGTGGLGDDELIGIGVLVSIIPLALLFFLMPILNFLLFYYPAIRHIATTLRLTEISSLERIVQSSKDDPRFGEGLAAALDFDVGGF